ncbi:MAG: 1-acyl-sn-glycerol-3-phosphate acyltransferase, partial [Cyanobacteria bacterium J06598_3]
MPSVTSRAQPALDFIPPNYSPWLRWIMRPVMPAWTAWQTDISEVETRNAKTLAKLYHEFEAGKTRILLAFRHPNPTDPYVLSHLLWQQLPVTARQLGLKISTPHSHFIYDRGIPLWAGSYLGWVFSRLGGVPIQRGKLDLLALKTARKLFSEGRFPLAAAPEGGNNGHNEIVSPLEPGLAQLSFWCAEDLKAQGREESVVILPVGIQYRYLEAPWPQLNALITQLEKDSGIGRPESAELAELQQLMSSRGAVVDAEHSALYGRMYRVAEHLLSLMESYYRDFYGATFESVRSEKAEAEGAQEVAGSSNVPNDQLVERLRSLMNESLQVAESYFKVRPKGTLIDRCRKIEQAGWDLELEMGAYDDDDDLTRSWRA